MIGKNKSKFIQNKKNKMNVYLMNRNLFKKITAINKREPQTSWILISLRIWVILGGHSKLGEPPSY